MSSLRARAFARRGFDHSQRVYDWWSRHDRVYRLFVAGFLLGRAATFRERTVDALALEPGDRVLDVGCGPGLNFRYLADAVGPTGSIVGVDTSRGMVTRAATRGAALDCPVDVVRGDATRLPIRDEQFEAVCATLSLSAMADVPAAVSELSRVLNPGGRLAILDTRPFQTAPGRWFNPLIEATSAVLTNWYPEADVVGAVERTFDDTCVDEFHGKIVFILTGQGRERADD